MSKWIKLYREHPDLYMKAEELERNGRNYPELVLPYNYNLGLLRKMIKAWDNNDPEYSQELLVNYQCINCVSSVTQKESKELKE